MLAGLFNSFMDANALGVAQLVGLGIAYAFVIGGFIYDLVKIRPLRNFYQGAGRRHDGPQGARGS